MSKAKMVLAKHRQGFLAVDLVQCRAQPEWCGD
jgi:hypothetical protein